MLCPSDCPDKDSWTLLGAEPGWVSCGGPAKYLVMPGVPAVWMARAAVVAKTQAGRRQCIDWPARSLVTGVPRTLPEVSSKECWEGNSLHS